MAVFVLDKRKKPLMPCSEKRARLLLERGRARVHRLVPFTIRGSWIGRWSGRCCNPCASILQIKATGRGAYQRTRLNKHGFPRGYLTRLKRHFGFQTGDMAKACVPSGKNAGVHIGRVAVRASGSFNIQTPQGIIQGISHSYCRLLQSGDGYGYLWINSATERRGGNRAALSLPDINTEISRARG